MGSTSGELLVADSFRVRVLSGTDVSEVRGFDLHLDRFREGVVEALEILACANAQAVAGPDWWELVFEPFMDTVPEQVAAGGEGFPRLELWLHTASDLLARREHSVLGLNVRTRPLPQLGSTIELATVPAVELTGVSAPWIKGPNITRYSELNHRLRSEALLLDSAGDIVEGATTSLIWWDESVDRGYFVAPPNRPGAPQGNRIDSVTETLVRALAPRRPRTRRPRPDGADALAPARITPAELARREVWAVNALHGIRRVTSIDGIPTPAPQRERLRYFRDALEDCWQPVLGEPQER